jgi:hypothetical protein
MANRTLFTSSPPCKNKQKKWRANSLLLSKLTTMISGLTTVKKIAALSKSLMMSEQDQFEILKRNADFGDAEAQYAVGLCYIEGKGVKQSLDSALKYFRLSANQDFFPAWTQLSLYTDKKNIKRIK